MFFGVSCFFFSFPLYGLFANGMNCLGHTFKVTAYFSLHFRLMTSIEDFFLGGGERKLPADFSMYLRIPWHQGKDMPLAKQNLQTLLFLSVGKRGTS